MERPAAASPSAHPVVLLHGQPGAAADWSGVAASLRHSVRVIAPDRPGWDGVGAPGGLAANGRWLLALLERQGVHRATLVGYSFGGAVACWVAAHAPERIGALVLAAPSANLASLYRLDRWLALPLLGGAAAAAGLGTAGLVLSASRARRAVAAQTRVPETYLRHAGRLLRSPRAWKAFAVEQQALLRELPALERELHRIAVPTTIVIGAEDWIVPAHSAERLRHDIRGAQLRRLEGAGHMLPLFQADRLADIILEAASRSSEPALLVDRQGNLNRS